MPKFIELVINMVTEWSHKNSQEINSTPFQLYRELVTKDYTDAYQFKRESRVMLSNTTIEFKNFYFSSSEGLKHSGQITNDRLKQFIKKRQELSYSSLEQLFLNKLCNIFYQ